MSKILVFGHQNPDTDAIASSIAFANWERQVAGADAEAVALGELNEETLFALEYFKIAAPRLVKRASDEGVKEVILTDHNEFQQSIEDIRDLTIVGVVDHHRIANFETANPLFFRAEPVGSASSIIARMYKEANLEITKELAGLMLSAIISDTLLLKSPTTHQTDIPLAKELAEIAGVDLEVYGLELLKAGTNLATKSASELIDLDAKTFELNGQNVRVAQVNTVDINEVLGRQDELESAIKEAIVTNGWTDFVLMITDIVNSNSEILAIGNHQDKVEAAFNFELKENHAFLAGAVSRKKQVVPQLTESFNQ
ncbi:MULTISPECIES: manganese-dependent inorganic pyrophosphatase [unclassified Enterococcus]|uniref:manganese-dependent inorganic pyrophosphatase n=1 Tax=unclassified Enterococcus TaxID=2608891 RepID=UPI001555A6A9|nr:MULTISPECIES: manganese-dependent inorganic pyrophosphatase [unclassified Enterococcus]MBS7576693.1 manganese-dependent inorganic pyrophosphatase [Enterococcus sp. MMGLQ5-2]MBS7583820.1 manganese-dependent inorganic pyrophosphatase [Enterococcus sp. MMGLQ5-1]NPD11681.1 manganese-dependent inorganic pyrophosphatase [Enterococcus sp. MMGLQ5-1]NPD36530.1 manganese-dependent inorganic pyrophosphatase [Enterococcus sp. MMGLQ5-2]